MTAALLAGLGRGRPLVAGDLYWVLGPPALVALAAQLRKIYDRSHR